MTVTEDVFNSFIIMKRFKFSAKPQSIHSIIGKYMSIRLICKSIYVEIILKLITNRI